MKTIRLGTRGSTLAMTQSRAIAERLRAAHPGLVVELVEIRTTGDRLQDIHLGPSVGQAFFTREIEDALLAGQLDLAVHSCKDLATVMPAGLTLAAIPEREEVRDALVSRSGRLARLPAGSRVATSSIRRQRFLAAARPDLELIGLRGNVPTRIAAVDDGRCEAVVVAAAGLRRLGLEDRITEMLDANLMLPAAAQGALAVQTREDDSTLRSLVSVIEDPGARAEVTAERACLRRLEAGCQSPVGALARVSGTDLELHAAVAAPDGIISVTLSLRTDDAETLGARVADALLVRLGLGSLKDAPWTGDPPRRLEQRRLDELPNA